MKASKNKVQSLIKSMKHGPYNVFTNEHEKYHMAVILQKTNILNINIGFFLYFLTINLSSVLLPRLFILFPQNDVF